jgi:hypothetical protein
VVDPQPKVVWLAPEERERQEREQAKERAKEIKKVLVAALRDRGWKGEPKSHWSWEGRDLIWRVHLDKGGWGPWHVELMGQWPIELRATEPSACWISVGCDRIKPFDDERNQRWMWALDHHHTSALPGRDDTLREIVGATCAWAEATPSVDALTVALANGGLPLLSLTRFGRGVQAA